MTETTHTQIAKTETAKTEVKVGTPRANLYETHEGWLLVVALPHVKRDDVELVTEGTKLELTATRELDDEREELRRTLQFPQGTRWGDLKAHWEGDLLHVELKRAEPERKVINIA